MDARSRKRELPFRHDLMLPRPRPRPQFKLNKHLSKSAAHGGQWEPEEQGHRPESGPPSTGRCLDAKKGGCGASTRHSSRVFQLTFHGLFAAQPLGVWGQAGWRKKGVCQWCQEQRITSHRIGVPCRLSVKKRRGAVRRTGWAGRQRRRRASLSIHNLPESLDCQCFKCLPAQRWMTALRSGTRPGTAVLSASGSRGAVMSLLGRDTAGRYLPLLFLPFRVHRACRGSKRTATTRQVECEAVNADQDSLASKDPSASACAGLAARRPKLFFSPLLWRPFYPGRYRRPFQCFPFLPRPPQKGPHPSHPRRRSRRTSPSSAAVASCIHPP